MLGRNLGRKFVRLADLVITFIGQDDGTIYFYAVGQPFESVGVHPIEKPSFIEGFLVYFSCFESEISGNLNAY